MRRLSKELWLELRKHTDITPECFADVMAKALHVASRKIEFSIVCPDGLTPGEIEEAKSKAFVEGGVSILSLMSSVKVVKSAPKEKTIIYEAIVLLPEA